MFYSSFESLRRLYQTDILKPVTVFAFLSLQTEFDLCRWFVDLSGDSGLQMELLGLLVEIIALYNHQLFVLVSVSLFNISILLPTFKRLTVLDDSASV